jgi:hypothetical protein
MTAPNFATVAAAATVVPVVTAGALNTNLAVGNVVVGFLDPIQGDRIFDAVAEGNAVASGDHASVWLPTVKAILATQITDNYWAPVFAANSASFTPPVSVGQIKLELTAAASNVVEAPSVLTFFLSPKALVLTVAGTVAF